MAYSTLPPQAAPYAPTTQGGRGIGITSLILGILSICGVIVWPCSLLLGLVGAILGIVGMRGGGKGLAITGLILSIVGICLSLSSGAFGIYLFSSGQLYDMFPSLKP